ncbi:MAG: hypothetical protein QOD42_2347 [Sphingomonadales bacterium]|jgi:hypothetical protein|nr:hypothetical protein [Sphingomonadales bacterium]
MDRPPVRYRYRTAAVIGPWRETPEAALRDAVKAGQAVVDEDEPGGVRWKLPGTIEADRRGRRP